MKERIRIIDYRPALAPYFKALNLAWIHKYFSVEPLDETVLSHPQQYILDRGGQIYFATYDDKVAGTFALMKVDEDTFELSKMAVSEDYQGLKIGHALLEAAAEKGKASGARKIILYSNTMLGPAIHLYHKYGFKEVPLGSSEYKRSNIKMEKLLA